MSYRTVTYGLTHEKNTGFSNIPDEPHMTTLMKQRQTEMWANNKTPYFVSYAPNGVAVYPDDQYLPWKRREYNVRPPTFEGTRFRWTKNEMKERTGTISTHQQGRK
eukprot:CAMPEP_0202889612 /NCGR_PEP_ID=MMETSP1392-20130828/202_1 /ASSEMBLY_ACC=CAM_ASM_000868 /TAXON_ID=225041 /ORGANISM="Chlamydomonas chlamydogama, Strain SAG 11-48b" /LENGTH=105 /DNA_ID=CAMNT_0049572985 /DNA_START=91 /DNA_END=408 /DNA_ORIENTATION=+